MADQGLWFKLWCASLDDPDLDNLDIADFGRWAKLGAFIKQQGQDGSLSVKAPARALCAMLQVEDFAAFQVCVSRLPNVIMRRENFDVANETIVTVTFANWAKYQGDFSTNRVRKFREMKRLRGEERRREEKRGERDIPPREKVAFPSVSQDEGQPVQYEPASEYEPPQKSMSSSEHSEGFTRFLSVHPWGKDGTSSEAWAIWQTLKLEPLAEHICTIVQRQKSSADWTKENFRYFPHPVRYLKNKRWEEQQPNGTPSLGVVSVKCAKCAQKDPGKRHTHWLTFTTEDELKQHFYDTYGVDGGQEKFIEHLPWWRTKQSIREAQRNGMHESKDEGHRGDMRHAQKIGDIRLSAKKTGILGAPD